MVWFFKNKKPSKKLWIGIATAFVGVALCFIEEARISKQMLGVNLALGAALIYSSYLVISESVLNNLTPIATSTFVCLGGAFSYFIKIILQENFTLPNGMQGYLALSAFTLLSTVLAILFIFEGIKLIGAAKASILSSIEPVTAIFIGVIFLDESMSVYKVIGFILVIFSVFYIAVNEQDR